ncbi:MAG TPA: outer membrane protein assembly factor BamA [Thermoanaerobaculia bacterium]|nr:outer membrane protein assembly factor BamA [Thermoanaerobaculia bacterium]
MTRLLTLTLAVALSAATVVEAQTEPPPQRPRPGTIIDTPSTGRITEAPAAPETPAGAEIVERFEAVGNVSVASDTVRVYLGVVPGEPYDPEALRRNFLNLWQTGLFDDIRLEAEQGQTGVIVRAIVTERPRIGSVEFRGNKELTSAKINEALERERIDLHVGSTIEQTLVRRAAETIRRAYSEGGFEGVSVGTSIEPMADPADRKIIFHISEGMKARVAEIEFTGNTVFSDRVLRSVMKEVKEHAVVSWVRKKNLFIPSRMDEDLERLKNHYQDHGYFDVSFSEPRLETIGRNRVRVLVTINEGGIHRFGKVTTSGSTLFTAEQITGDWPLKEGETIRRRPIQNRVDAFGEAYRMRGYIYAYVNPEYTKRPGSDEVVDVHIEVFEGDQFRLGRLEFQGNTTTKDKVLRREMFVEEGQIMDMETFKQSLYKLGQLGYFKVTENPDFKVNQDTKTVDITVKGTEEGRNDIQFGGGYSEGGGAFVQAMFATRNFMGEGENFSLGYQRGNRINYFSLSYADPWFLDTPNSLGISMFNRDSQYPERYGFNSRSRGATLAYGYRLGRFDSVSFLYGLERAETLYEFVTLPDEQGNVPISAISDYTFTMSSVVPAYRYDSRDNPFDPIRGSRINASVAYSGGPLGGTIELLKPRVTLSRFFRMTRRSAFSVNLEGGYIHPLTGGCSHSYAEREETGQTLCVPEVERFTVGGEYSVRGFELGTLGPFEIYLGESRPVGGYKYHTYNFEYIYRLNDPLRLVLFADAGKAYGYRENIDFSSLRYSVGAELRIFLPVFQFPLRFIYAMNPDKRPGDFFQGFQFTIGNTF